MHIYLAYIILYVSCLLPHQTRRTVLLLCVAWGRHKVVVRVVAPGVKLLHLTRGEPAVQGDRASQHVPDPQEVTTLAPQMIVVSECYTQHIHTHHNIHTHTITHTHTTTHTHTPHTLHGACCSFLFITSPDQENVPPAACDMGEMQAGGQSRGTRAIVTAAPSNKRGASRGRRGSQLAHTRPTGGDHASASDNGK